MGQDLQKTVMFLEHLVHLMWEKKGEGGWGGSDRNTFGNVPSFVHLYHLRENRSRLTGGIMLLF